MMTFPFCPNKHCSLHQQAPADTSWFSPKGSYHTKAFGIVHRFQCKVCHTTFSTQTFSQAYYLKKLIPLPELVGRLASGESLRAMSRNLAIAPKTVQNRIERLSRQSLAFHTKALSHLKHHDAVCIDGLVSFDTSQYFPSEIPIAITANSQFIIDFSHASRKRSGTMTAAQKEKAAVLYRQVTLERGAISRSFKETLISAFHYQPPARFRPFILITDEKPEYQRVVFRLDEFRFQTDTRWFIHQRIWSKLPRTIHNPLFSSNYIEREVRKDMAHHHRETECFNRNVSNGMLRMGLYLLWHNYAKPFRIRAKQGTRPLTHAEAAGIPIWIIEQFLKTLTEGMRAFFSRIKLTAAMERTWVKGWITPGKQANDSIPAYVLG